MPTNWQRDVLPARAKAARRRILRRQTRAKLDRVEIPEIKPDVTRVSLHGGVCPCCAKRFKAEPPEGLERDRRSAKPARLLI